MVDLVNSIPVDALLTLDPAELGVKLIFLLKEDDRDKFTMNAVMDCIPGNASTGWPGYPAEKHHLAERAIFEAWNWLEANGFLVWSDMANGRNGYRRLSRKAESYADEASMIEYTSSLPLPRELLHERIAEKVWLDFVRKNYDEAVFAAFKEVEVYVREAAKFTDADYGVKLMRTAFHPQKGPLTDKSLLDSEREAMQQLFAGAIGLLKNPQSHRHVGTTSPEDAVAMVMTANYLLRIVDQRQV